MDIHRHAEPNPPDADGNLLRSIALHLRTLAADSLPQPTGRPFHSRHRLRSQSGRSTCHAAIGRQYDAGRNGSGRLPARHHGSSHGCTWHHVALAHALASAPSTGHATHHRSHHQLRYRQHHTAAELWCNRGRRKEFHRLGNGQLRQRKFRQATHLPLPCKSWTPLLCPAHQTAGRIAPR